MAMLLMQEDNDLEDLVRLHGNKWKVRSRSVKDVRRSWLGCLHLVSIAGCSLQGLVRVAYL